MPSLLQSRRARVVAIVAAVSLSLQWWLAAYPRGMLMAYLDHARGHYQVLTWGFPGGGDYPFLLNERYGVQLHRIGGCSVAPWVAWYANGYNTVSRRLLTEKYGRNIFWECRVEAERRWQAEHMDS